MMIRRIVTDTVRKGSKVRKDIPLCRNYTYQWSSIDCGGRSSVCGNSACRSNHKDNTRRLYSDSAIAPTTLLQLLLSNRQSNNAYFSTTTESEVSGEYDETSPPIGPVLNPRYAVVHHGKAYQKAMRGLHGQQLAIAQLEGEGKDEPDFDPFLEEELEEDRLLYEKEKLLKQKQQTEDKPASSTSTANATSNDKDSAAAVDKQESFSDEDGKENKESVVDDDEDDDDALINTISQQQLDQYKVFRQKYNNDGSIKRNESEMAILRAGSPAGGRIAVVALGGTQYKVTTDDVLIVNLLKPVSYYAVGTVRTLTNEQVLLVSSSAMTCVGMPYVSGAEVDVMVEEITRDAKVVIFKKRRRKNSQRRTGFRRDVTMLRILDIRFPTQYDDHEHTIRPEPAPLISKTTRKLV